MRRRSIAIFALLLLPAALVTVGGQAAAEAAYFETPVAPDPAGDFETPHNGALDILGVHVSERYSIEHGETIQFRVELRDRDGIESFAGQVDLQYTLSFKLNGQDVTTTTLMTQTCSPSADRGLDCTAPVVEAPHYTTSTLGIVFMFPREASNMPVGSVISEISAASAIVSPTGAVYQDVAPEDNANQPAGDSPVPDAPGGPVTLTGTFPFFILERLSAHHQPIVPGGTAEYDFRITMHPDYSGLDRIIVQLAASPGWTLEANLGTDFIVPNGGESVDMTLTVKAPALAAVGDSTSISMDLILLQAGGHAGHSVLSEVTGPKAEIPAYEFQLVEPGPFRAEAPSTFKASVVKDGTPLLRYGVSYDFIKDGATVATVKASEPEDGMYVAQYTFPSSGEWTVDVYVSELAPSPHQAFPVTVKGAEGSPSIGPLMVILVVLSAVVLRRRPQ